MSNKNILIDESDDGQRLDRWLQQKYPHITYPFIQKALRKGDVKINGKKVTGKERLSSGQELRLPPAFHHAPEPGAFRPLSENELQQAKWFGDPGRHKNQIPCGSFIARIHGCIRRSSETGAPFG